MAASMIGSSSWMAVFGKPLFTASSTFCHCFARSGGFAGLAANRIAMPATAKTPEEPINSPRVRRDIGDLAREGIGVYGAVCEAALCHAMRRGAREWRLGL